MESEKGYTFALQLAEKDLEFFVNFHFFRIKYNSIIVIPRIEF
jgi:hypothetical protein